MTASQVTQCLTIAEPFLCIAALLAIWMRGQLRSYWFLGLFLGFRAASDLEMNALLSAYARRLSVGLQYNLYFYSYWVSYAVEALLGFVVLYGLYQLAMRPLPGLQRLGNIMFRWAAGIALAISAAMALGPHTTGVTIAIRFVSQMQQTQSVLTLCMLFFVALAVRPMGWSNYTKIFGVCLGMGVMAANDLVASSWIVVQDKHMSNMTSLISGLAAALALLIWTSYFALPQAKRKMVTLPTTSPFLRWNQISGILNDNPGHVALGEVDEDLFASAELTMMDRAVKQMRSNAAQIHQVMA